MTTRVSVVMTEEDACRFEAFCQERGHKKSTLIVRLIKEHLEKECFYYQAPLNMPNMGSGIKEGDLVSKQQRLKR